MKRILLIPAMAFAFFMVGCTGNPSKVDTEHQHIEADVSHSETDEHAVGLTPLTDQVELDNGEKWVANIETNEGIDNMLALVKKEESKETPDYVALKEGLDLEFNVVLEKCTMTGESHDQLHNYLLPLKAKINQLGQGASKESVGEVGKYVLTYYEYFK